jgi:hypothetical protein
MHMRMAVARAINLNGAVDVRDIIIPGIKVYYKGCVNLNPRRECSRQIPWGGRHRYCRWGSDFLNDVKLLLYKDSKATQLYSPLY